MNNDTMKNPEKKKVTKLDIAKLILGSTAASGATGIV